MKQLYVLRLITELVKFIKSDWFDPRKSFLKLPAFWCPLVIILIFAIILCWKIKIDHDLQFDITADVDEWVALFQVPIGVMALLIPILGLFNANHKSEQTKATMELSKAQNNFSNYYKHLEEFSKHVEKIYPLSNNKNIDFSKVNVVCDYRKAHKFFYAESFDGVYEIDAVHINSFIGIIDKYISASKKIVHGNAGDIYLDGQLRPFGELKLYIQENFSSIAISISFGKESVPWIVLFYIEQIKKLMNFDRHFIGIVEIEKKMLEVKCEFERLCKLNEEIFYIGTKVN